MTVAHWDDVPEHHRARGEMDAVWQALGDAAGTVGVGVNRVRVAPGKLPTPPHSHSVSEELYFVLSGSGLAWQDGHVHGVRPGDCVVQRADELEHTFVAGPDGLEYLVFGTRHETEFGWLPRSRALRLGRPWVEGRVDDPWEIEASAPPLDVGEPEARPANIVNVDEVEPETWEGRLTAWRLATPERALRAGLHYETLAAGRRGVPPHCHSEEEEIFVVLAGSATLELTPSPRPLPGSESGEVELRPGHVVARPPGTRVSHSFRAGPEGLTMLVYGTRRPNDIVWYARSRKIFWRGVGVLGRVETLEYFDGEPVEDD